MADKIKELVRKLNDYREKYYNNGVSEISDEEFDFEERRLKEMDPNNPYFLQVGRKNTTRDVPIEHEVPMLSMQKVQVAEDAIDWYYKIIKTPGLHFNELNPGLWEDPKLDGISGKIVYDSKGNFKYASTRGDGQIGALISYGKEIDGVPPTFLADSELRGEFIINKKFSKLYSPLRNNCSGILKRNEMSDDVHNVSFVIYDVHNYKMNNAIRFKDRKDKLNQIERILKDNDFNGYHIVKLRKVYDIKKAYEDYVNNWRDAYEYETDGVILTVDGGQDNYDIINSNYKITTCNRFNMALKPPAEFAQSKVKKIHIYVNRQKLSFVAEFNPIFINGVEIERATLDNYTTMKKLNIGEGSTVLVKRSNDVIPKIVKSYNADGDKITYIDPKVCPCCGAELLKYNQDLMCPNEFGCSDIFISKLEFLLGKLGVKNIGHSTIVKFVNMMINDNRTLTFKDFFEIILDDVALNNYMDRIFNDSNSKLAIRFKDSMKFILNNKITEVSVIGAFNIPFVGETELINHGIKTYKQFVDYVNDLKDKKTLERAFDTYLYKWFNEETHRIDLRETIDLLKPYFKEIESDSGKITYCISGDNPGWKHKKDIINKLSEVNNDLKFVDSVSLGLGFLISSEEGTTKVLKAKKYKIPVLTVEQAIERYTK